MASRNARSGGALRVAVRVAVRVRPGSARPAVGGAHAGALVVAVAARAVDGAATRATLAAVAEAFGVRQRDVRLVTGATSRDKVVEVAGDETRLSEVLGLLLDGGKVPDTP